MMAGTPIVKIGSGDCLISGDHPKKTWVAPQKLVCCRRLKNKTICIMARQTPCPKVGANCRGNDSDNKRGVG